MCRDQLRKHCLSVGVALLSVSLIACGDTDATSTANKSHRLLEADVSFFLDTINITDWTIIEPFDLSQGAGENGEWCYGDSQCNSGYCSGFRCAPIDGTAQADEYCHHDNHCYTGQCVCQYGSGKDIFGVCIQPEGGTCSSAADNGAECNTDNGCASGRCIDWRCGPADKAARSGEYCHHDNHCSDTLSSGECECSGKYLNGVCTGAGSCGSKTADGIVCSADEQCTSGRCVDWRCGPNDGTAAANEYCHHDNHCSDTYSSGECLCDNKYVTGVCFGDGICGSKKFDGDACTDGEQCDSGRCVDWRCGPEDRTARYGEYCHHDNHCASTTCDCGVRDWRGVCYSGGTCI